MADGHKGDEALIGNADLAQDALGFDQLRGCGRDRLIAGVCLPPRLTSKVSGHHDSVHFVAIVALIVSGAPSAFLICRLPI